MAADYEDHVFTGNANTGDAGDNNGTGYAGGSGIVVIRYVVEKCLKDEYIGIMMVQRLSMQK